MLHSTHTHAVFHPTDVANIDRAAIKSLAIDDYQLMQTAAASLLQLARQRWPGLRHCTVLVGPGNNGGDGVELARLARAAGLSASLVSAWSSKQLDDKLTGAAGSAWQTWKASGGERPHSELPTEPGLIIDALFGAGLDRPLAGDWLTLVQQANASPAPVLAVDAPSGLNGATGAAWPEAVHADTTLCLVALKTGLLTGAGADYCGQLYFDSLDVPDSAHQVVSPAARLISQTDLQAIPQRRDAAHKGDAGQALLAGGAPGMAGAIVLAGEACARVGAGLTRVWTHSDHVSGLVGQRPELLWTGVERPLPSIPERVTALAIGPGLGRDTFARGLFRHLAACLKPTVIDADGLYWLARGPRPAGPLVLTPHPGEAAMLLRCSVAEVEQDRLAAVDRLAKQFQAVVVLKGAGSLVSDGQQRLLCQHGHSGMASAGMGDVLTGVIAGLLAQGMDTLPAAACGVLLHAGAADLAGGDAPLGLLASDLAPWLRTLRNRPDTLPAGRLQIWQGTR